ncbi:MAG: methyltransferase domain-containing protein [Dysgonomonas sp.]|nr:methyltransferase domain-containing protein [Dysgonomonas sp.]
MDLRSQFNSIAQSYDRQRPVFIPCFYDFYGVAIENLELDNQYPHILDLGAGTGLFSDFVIQKYPCVNITLVDISEKMLKIAEQRFLNNKNIEMVCHDISTFMSQIQYDAVISSLAIHHLEDTEKINLYNRIYSFLKKDGLFIHAEQVEGETPYMKELNEARWKNGVENSCLTREEIDAGYERVKLDKRVPLSKQLRWLKDSGFSEVDCVYKYYDFTVIYCKK